MKLNRVVIVVKPLTVADRRAQNAFAGTTKSLHLRREHAEALKRIIADLEALGIKYRVIPREALKRPVDADLIIPVGGDGTFLAASHAADTIPLLGVNPDTSASVGFFCITEAAGFGRILERVGAGKISPLELPLIGTQLGKRELPVLALNDVLFAGRSPAETVRYFLTVSGKMEYHRSSGVWIAAGPGSTAAISSAGGKAMEITSRRLQYLVREPCPMPGVAYKHLGGCVHAGKPIAIASAMEDSAIYIDGPSHAYPVPKGSVITCRISSRTLKVFL